MRVWVVGVGVGVWGETPSIINYIRKRNGGKKTDVKALAVADGIFSSVITDGLFP